ncbi:hypothetical protein [Pseudomonas purpurea]|uniref:hypothetical protein n=1 Tax=Pseudomonas purpurea TaxID=3136737 RepID=UPI003266FE46
MNVRITATAFFAVSLLSATNPCLAAPWIPPTHYKKSVEVYFGGMRGEYTGSSSLTGEQVFDALSVPDTPQKTTVSDQTILFAGCRYHSCTEKAAIIIGPQDNVLSAALISNKCRTLQRPRKHTTCDETPTLTLFEKPGDTAHAYREILKDWGDTKVADIPVEYQVVK